MHGKRIKLTRTRADQDPQCIRDFVMGIMHSPAYKDIIAQVIEFPGFCWKKQIIKDTVDDSIFVSELAFDTEENFNNFINHPMIMTAEQILLEAARENQLHVNTENTDQLDSDV